MCGTDADEFSESAQRARHGLVQLDLAKSGRERLVRWAMDEIDRVFADDPLRPHAVDLSYLTLRQRAERIGWVQTPRIVEELWSARRGAP
jgi:hypothetical protein